MMRRLTVTVLLLVTPVFSSAATDIYQLIVEGDLRQAADSLSSVSTASTRDGDLLFYAGLMETDGAKAIKFMQAALQASVSPLHREQIYRRLAQYYHINRDLENLGRVVTDYLSRWEVGRYRDEMLRYSILVDDLQAQYESALRQLDHYALSYKDGDPGLWGRLDKARIMMHHGKKIGAAKVLKKLARKKSGVVVPPAMYLLTLAAIADGRTDDAVFYHSLLKESYPSAVGVDALLDRMSDVSPAGASDQTANELTGTYYSVRLGVFSVKANADNMVAAFKRYGKKTEALNKKISDKMYHVVYIGRFSDYQSASSFKEALQTEHNQVFQVVAR
ncbi:MAG: SPOR domain-containing protein [candidate division Zixibacteria bacterium]|nr:SPOR domain-containing protein [candidate division Zixibacteria bacterium]MDH3938667.1 SPOR domain-containing protein [candidate division Zixibacteria bacterium]